MCPTRRANFQHDGTIFRLINFLNPASYQNRGTLTYHFRNFCHSQCHNLLPIGVRAQTQQTRLTMKEEGFSLRALIRSAQGHAFLSHGTKSVTSISRLDWAPFVSTLRFIGKTRKLSPPRLWHCDCFFRQGIGWAHSCYTEKEKGRRRLQR